jgi:hypothetical protein
MTLDFSNRYSIDDLRAAINENFDNLRTLIEGLTNEQVLYEPYDDEANDPYATQTEDRTIGWSIAHLALHVTASLEEGSAVGSLLARNVSPEPGTRFRYEPKWRAITDKEQVFQRLTESQRMCLAYLDTWPDAPHLDNLRRYAEGTPMAKAETNAVGSVLGGVRHWYNHIEQFKKVAEQAKAATTSQP